MRKQLLCSLLALTMGGQLLAQNLYSKYECMHVTVLMGK